MVEHVGYMRGKHGEHKRDKGEYMVEPGEYNMFNKKTGEYMRGQGNILCNRVLI